jgi:hypothetical protein
MPLRSLVALSALVVAFAGVPDSVVVGHSDDEFAGLQPGEFVVHTQRVPIRIVLIGFEEGQVNETEILSILPTTYKPLVRNAQFYGLSGRDLGLEYEFEYQFTRKSQSFSTAFFRYLRRIGTPGPPTFFQQLYNDQNTNVLDVTGPVLYIDAPSVERWLDEHDSAGHRNDSDDRDWRRFHSENDDDDDNGEDERRDRRLERRYTIYFVNWYGRSDFRFHVYTKTDDPDPDTGFNFGLLAQTAINSWGGTSSRSWFYDFSAGPEWNSTNYVVDVKDLNGDGIDDYRMPVIWEYAPTGYRLPAALSQDMGFLARFVAINLIFTPSPYYDPLVTAPGRHGAKVTDISLLEDDPLSKGIDFIDPEFAKAKLRAFQPQYRWRAPLRSFDPIDAGAKRALDIFAGNLIEDDCWTEFGNPFAQLFCYFNDSLEHYVPPYPPRDYVAEVFAFNTTTQGLGQWFGLLGFADDNWTDGTQTFAFAFDSQAYRDAGFGFTATIVHEVGHHIGQSHPHDGYDAEFGIDYAPGGFFYFAWDGDESDSVMSYIALSNNFSQFDRDNSYRWETAGYLNWSNALAAAILASPDASEVEDELHEADREAHHALQAFRRWQYFSAVKSARRAYTILSRAAEEIGASSTTLAIARMRLANAPPPKDGCRPRLLKELLGI